MSYKIYTKSKAPNGGTPALEPTVTISPNNKIYFNKLALQLLGGIQHIAVLVDKDSHKIVFVRHMEGWKLTISKNNSTGSIGCTQPIKDNDIPIGRYRVRKVRRHPKDKEVLGFDWMTDKIK